MTHFVLDYVLQRGAGGGRYYSHRHCEGTGNAYVGHIVNDMQRKHLLGCQKPSFILFYRVRDLRLKGYDVHLCTKGSCCQAFHQVTEV